MSTEPRAPRTLIDEIARLERELDALRRELSRHRTETRLPYGALSLVLCRMGERRVAFRQDVVDEIVAMPALTALPDAPPWIMGLLQLGDERIAVLDAWARESGVRREPDPDSLLVVARARRGRVALVVDALDGLATVESSSVTIPGPEVVFAPHVLGVVDVAGASTLVLTVDALTPDELATT